MSIALTPQILIDVGFQMGKQKLEQQGGFKPFILGISRKGEHKLYSLRITDREKKRCML